MFAAASRATTQDQSGLTKEAIWGYTPPSSTFNKLCSDSLGHPPHIVLRKYSFYSWDLQEMSLDVSVSSSKIGNILIYYPDADKI